MSAARYRRFLVAGGTGAFGSEIVQRLRRDGAEVTFSGRNHERGSALAQRTGARFVAGDSSRPGAVGEIVAESLSQLGGLDGLVLAAGVLHRSALSATADEAWDTLLETNLVAQFLFARACFPALSDAGGAIVALASGTADWPEVDLGAYSVSKRALLWLIRMLAVEGATRGVRANAVCPGHTSIGMGSVVNGPAQGSDRSDHPAPLPPSGNHTNVAQVAEAVAYLLSDAAAGSTGATLTVDGGMLAAMRAVRVRQ